MNWGLLLIALGVLWLLSNFGWFNWSFWNAAWLLFPLAFILVGLNFLLRGNKQRLPILALVGVVGAALLLAWNARPGGGGSVEDINIPLDRASQAEISLSSGVGRLEVGALEDSGGLVQGRIELLPGERLEREVNTRGDTAVVKIGVRGTTSGFRGRRGEGWNLKLSPRVPLNLNIDTGVGESELALSALKLTALQVNSGVGRVVVDLPVGSYRAELSGGVGELKVNVPRDVALRLQANAGLGGVDVPNGLLKQGDNRYQSPDYDRATNRVELEVSGGVGRVDINQ